MKVTLLPWQMTLEGLAAMLIPAVPEGLTDAIIIFDKAGLPETQLAVLIISHSIWSELISVLSEKVELFVPTLMLFFFH